MDEKPLLSKSQEINFFNEFDNEYSETYEDNFAEEDKEKNSPNFESDEKMLDNLQNSHLTENKQPEICLSK